MTQIIPDGELIGTLRYGRATSEIYWFRGNNATIEIIPLGNDFFLVRGSKQYYISDIHDPQQFHSKLQEIGKFSDYLKESVPSFSLSMFYIGSLTSGIIKTDTAITEQQIGELKRGITHRESKLTALREEHEVLGNPIGREGIGLESQIKEKREQLKKLEESKEKQEQLKNEYLSKGHGASIVVKTQSSSHPCRKNNLETTIQLVLTDLKNFDGTIKNRAKQGFHLVINELPNPSLAYSTESLGIFDPHVVEELSKEFPEMEGLREQIDSIFVHRWAKDARIGERSFEKSAAIAQGIASLLRQASGKSESEPKTKQPLWDKLPFYNPKMRHGFLGYIHDGYLERTKFPLLIDYDLHLLTHVAIVGAAGYGKTITAYDIAEGAFFHGIPVLVLDPTGQWSGFIEKCEEKQLLDKYKEFGMKEPSGFRTKIFTPSSDVGATINTNLLEKPQTTKISELQAYSSELSKIIQSFCDLVDNESIEVQNTILNAWTNNVIIDYNSLISSSTKEITKRKLQNLASVSFLFEGKGLPDISTLWKEGEISVISLTEVKVESVKMFVAYYLLRELVNYFDSQPDSDKMKLLLVIEEAHRFRETKVHSILDRAAKTLRKKGVGIIFITQVIVDIEEIRANTSMKIFMRVGYDRDIERARIDMGTEFSSLLPSMKKGEGIISYPEFETPLVVSFRPCFHKNTRISASEIKEKMIEWRERDTSPLLKSSSQLESPLKELSNEEKFLNEVKAYRNETGKDPRYTDIMSRLNWKSDKIGTQVKKNLINQGKLKEIPDPEDKRAKRLVVISA